MNRRSMIASLVILWAIHLSAARPAAAAEYESEFGFGISVPDIWLVLTRGEILERAGHFRSEESGESVEDTALSLASVPIAMRRAVYDRVRAGELEMFYRRAEKPGRFIDNVNVMTQSADLPSTPEQLVGICRALPSEFSRIFGRPIAMDVCEMRERIGRRALYLEFDGAIPGTTTLHYQLQHGLGKTLVFTATTVSPNLPLIIGEFEGMIASIRLH